MPSRKLSDGHPDIEAKALEHFSSTLEAAGDDTARLDRWLRCLERLTELTPPRRIAVIGCGPRPLTVRLLLERGHHAVGIEPVPSFVESANRYTERPGSVLQGTAEHIPLADASQDIVFCENVLEHVDSPSISLREMYRVATPGSVTMIYTTNRYRFNLRGENGEFNLPFFNWFPPLVKESFVFEHLHNRPSLANYTPRPAVHWFSYTDLCRLGREAGFAQFYGLPDLLDPADPEVAGSKFRVRVLRQVKRNPWLRALAMSQLGHLIFMLKRR